MKNLIVVILVSMLAASCGPGKWVGGNKQLNDRRIELRAKKAELLNQKK